MSISHKFIANLGSRGNRVRSRRVWGALSSPKPTSSPIGQNRSENTIVARWRNSRAGRETRKKSGGFQVAGWRNACRRLQIPVPRGYWARLPARKRYFRSPLLAVASSGPAAAKLGANSIDGSGYRKSDSPTLNGCRHFDVRRTITPASPGGKASR